MGIECFFARFTHTARMSWSALVLSKSFKYTYRCAESCKEGGVPKERTNHYTCSFFKERSGHFHAFLTLLQNVTQSAERWYSTCCHACE